MWRLNTDFTPAAKPTLLKLSLLKLARSRGLSSLSVHNSSAPSRGCSLRRQRHSRPSPKKRSHPRASRVARRRPCTAHTSHFSSAALADEVVYGKTVISLGLIDYQADDAERELSRRARALPDTSRGRLRSSSCRTWRTSWRARCASSQKRALRSSRSTRRAT